MSNLSTRIITAGVFILIMIAGIFYHPYSLMLLFGIFCFVGLLEYANMCQKTEPAQPYSNADKWMLPLAGSLIYLLFSSVFLSILAFKQLAFALPFVLLFFIRELYQKSRFPYVRLGLFITGIVYIAIPFAMVNGIAVFGKTFEPMRIMGIFLIIGANDTAAYFAGRFLGKHPLFKRISPKKTWEGFAGGIVGSLAMASLFVYLQLDAFDALTWYITALISIVFGSWGDLVESLLKRSTDTKDSGNILPGHGGILDRFDAFIFSVPFILAFLYGYAG